MLNKKIKNIIKNLSIEEKIGQLMMENFLGKKEIPDSTKEAILKGRIGNIIYFSGCNVDNGLQLSELSGKVQKIFAKTKHKIPGLIAIDQEGGQLAAVREKATIGPGNMAIGATFDKNAAFTIGKIAGRELNAMNINLNLAPVLDTACNKDLPVYDNRIFGSCPEFVGKMGIAYIMGCQQAKVAACAKHFPGLSNTEKDTHNELDMIDKSLNILERNEFLPFKMAIKGGVSSVLTSHTIYPAIDKKFPATLSKKIINEYLRKKLKFNGVVITDDLYMKAIIKNYGLEEAAFFALIAGADIILAAVSTEGIHKYLVKQAQKGKLSEDIINQAVERVLKLKLKYTDKIKNISVTKKILNNKVFIAQSQKIAEKAVTLVKNQEKLIPLKPKENEKICIIQPAIIRLCMSDTSNLYGDSILKKEIEKYHNKVEEHIVGINPTKEEIDSLHDNVFISDIIIACTANAYKFTGQVEMIKMICEFKKMGKKIITVALRSPSDIAFYNEVDTHILTYGNWPDNIRALVKIIFGESKVYGKLPVNIFNLYKSGFKNK